MTTLTFYGSSDDNFCYDINGKGGDEIGCFDKRAVWGIGPKDGKPQVFIVGEYAPKELKLAPWLIGVCQVDEDVPIPTFTYAYSTYENGYSVALSVTIPDDDFEVTQVHPKAED